MMLATHSVVGSVIGAAFASNPVLAAAGGFASHFFLDAIPHWDYPLASGHKDPSNPMNNTISLNKAFVFDLLKIGLDMMIGIAVVLLLFFQAPIHVFVGALIGMVFGVLPDFLQFVYFRFPRGPMVLLQKFHVIFAHAKSNLNDRPVLGIGFQIAIIAVLAFISKK